MISIKTGVAVAAAAASLFVLNAPASAADMKDKAMADVKCAGANSCKGTSDCKTATSSCKGQNSCKGKGWVKSASMDACKAAGGKVVS